MIHKRSDERRKNYDERCSILMKVTSIMMKVIAIMMMSLFTIIPHSRRPQLDIRLAEIGRHTMENNVAKKPSDKFKAGCRHSIVILSWFS